MSFSAQTSGRGSAGTPTQREHELQKENLKLSSENLELRFQLEQANKDLPRLKVGLRSSVRLAILYFAQYQGRGAGTLWLQG